MYWEGSSAREIGKILASKVPLQAECSRVKDMNIGNAWRLPRGYVDERGKRDSVTNEHCHKPRRSSQYALLSSMLCILPQLLGLSLCLSVCHGRS